MTMITAIKFNDHWFSYKSRRNLNADITASVPDKETDLFNEQLFLESIRLVHSLSCWSTQCRSPITAWYFFTSLFMSIDRPHEQQNQWIISSASQIWQPSPFSMKRGISQQIEMLSPVIYSSGKILFAFQKVILIFAFHKFICLWHEFNQKSEIL